MFTLCLPSIQGGAVAWWFDGAAVQVDDVGQSHLNPLVWNNTYTMQFNFEVSIGLGIVTP